MKVTSDGIAKAFSELSPGDWYICELHNKKVFGIAVQRPDQGLAAFVFSVVHNDALPWVALGGHPYTVLQLPNVEVRPDLSSVHFNSPDFGHLTSAGGRFFMKGSIRRLDALTINLSTGASETVPSNVSFANFSRWSAGVVREGRWVSLFDHPRSAIEAVHAED